MKLIEKINDLFSYDKYYKMSNTDLEQEAKRYKLESCYNQFGNIVRTEVINQLIAKDNASMFKKSLVVSFMMLVVSFFTLIISINSLISNFITVLLK